MSNATSTDTGPTAFDLEASEDGTIRAAPMPDDAEGEEDGSASEATPEERVDAATKTEGELLAEQARREASAPKRAGAKPGRRRPADPPAAPGFRLREPMPQESMSDNPKDWTDDPFAVWSIMCGGWLGKQGLDPSAIGISVSRRLSGGPIAGEELKLSQIKGSDIAPYGPWTASEVLERHLLDVYHAVGGQGGRQGCGPARYTLAFYWSNRGGTIKTTHIDFDSYFVMKEQRDRTDQARAHKRGAEEVQSFQQPPPFAGPGGPTGTMPMPVRVGPAAPPAVAAPVQGASGPDQSLYVELGYLRAIKEENERARAENRAPREIAEPVAVAPAAQGMSPAEVARIAGEAAAVAVREALAAAGIRPKTEADRLEELLARNQEATLKNIQALYGPPPATGAGAAAAAVPPPTAPAAATTVASTVEALKQLMAEFKTVKEAEGTFREMLGVEPEDRSEAIEPKVIHVEDKPKPDFLDRAIGFFKSLPPGAMAQTMAAAGVIFEGSPAGQLLQKAAAAAQAAQTAGSVVNPRGGWGGGTPSAG